ncbi:hypothetical protein [Streptomyces sp. CB02400]|uniref:hypothetical protein n=1 Tax=Streptomyces sp. CB02400 TaxID=1703944 RepID=UPI001161307B|nr:hypothetical protein [Streptomyces sp. CB02400]
MTRWLGGCAGLTAGAAVLAFVAVALWVAYAVPAFFDRAEVPTDESFGKQSGLTRSRIARALGDGVLTDQEISHAATRNEWQARLTDSTPRVVVKYRANGSHRCYSFLFPDGLTERGAVRSTPLDRCPF